MILVTPDEKEKRYHKLIAFNYVLINVLNNNETPGVIYGNNASEVKNIFNEFNTYNYPFRKELR